MVRNLLSAVFSVILALSATGMASGAHAQSTEMWLTIDQVRAYDLRQPVASIVVGNPVIADVTVQPNNKVLLYGKAPGLTNIYFFDKDGNRLENLNVRVQSQTSDMLVVYRGTQRTSYTCTRNCEMTPVIGDSPEVFEAVSSQSQTKNAEIRSQSQANDR